jgi:hypothetical protein
MRVAIIQPYFLPYIGYFELLASADVVIWLDDVQFPRRSWVNRNRFRVVGDGSRWAYLTIPVRHADRRATIASMSPCFPQSWQTRLEKWFSLVYGESALFHPLAKSLFTLPDQSDAKLSTLLIGLLTACMKQLHIPRETVLSSEIEIPARLGREERIISLTQAVRGTTYLNLSGGKSLYDACRFRSAGLDLEFLSLTGFPKLNECCDHLSILDLVLAGHKCMVEDHLQRFVAHK